MPICIPTRRRNKYGAKAALVNGIRFASQKEAARYLELVLLERAGEIWDLELQPRFPLHAPSTSGYAMRAAKALAEGGTFLIGHYVADFKYRDANTVPYVVEDVKSPATRTALYRWKKRHLMAQYGIDIKEV